MYVSRTRTFFPTLDNRASLSMDPVKVFIVDDSAHLTEVLSELICDPGKVIVCGTAETADDAIAGIGRTSPDVVVADLQLRVGTGFDVVKAIRATGNRDMLVVLFSNHMRPELQKHALALGADHFLDKSSDHGRLIELIGEQAEARRR